MYQEPVGRLRNRPESCQVQNVASLLAEALIHRSTQKTDSRRLGCKILHSRGPNELATLRSTFVAPPPPPAAAADLDADLAAGAVSVAVALVLFGAKQAVRDVYAPRCAAHGLDAGANLIRRLLT
jgi:hypothetical protein